jgi:hypothetical protein
MSREIFKTLSFILTIFLTFSVFGQSRTYKNSYSQRDFEKNKIYDQTYHLWQYNNRWFPNKNDTLIHPYFVDDRNYKGLINYGIQFKSKDFRNFYFIEGLYMRFMKVDYEKVRFNPIDSIIEIEGYISGGWGDLTKKELSDHSIDSQIDVFLGERVDTIKHCYYNKIVNEDYIDVKLNNREINETTILDSFPAFYFKNCSHYRTNSQKGRREFKIRGKVTKNTILAFGGYKCYSEVFDIGSMVYYPKKNNNRKKRKAKEESAFKSLIVNNVLVSDIDKNKLISKEINYYTYTEKAENFILLNQFAKAKEQYNLLNLNYSSLYARDIHNAIRCAILSRDLKTAFTWAKKLADKGVRISYFNAKIFNPLRKSIDWKNFSTQYDSIYNLNQKKINSNLKAQIEQLLNEDQANYGLENRKEPQVLYETTESVTDKLIELLQKEGYPSEEKIGVFTKNDTILIQSPDYNVILRHAVQQKPKGLSRLMELLDKSAKMLEYDKERSSNHKNFPSACYHIYKGNLYKDKSCSNVSLTENKIKFMFKNTNNFIIDFGDFIISEYNKEHPEEYDKYYEGKYNLIMKLTDYWEFYEKN